MVSPADCRDVVKEADVVVTVLLAVVVPVGLLTLGTGAYSLWVRFGTEEPWRHGGGGDSGDTRGGA
ncbi:hypothetical protein ACIPQA_23700 [Streptomyces sp. NPDC090109]|uniref:hypothetical protein n=1 Tax=unclassified Streptomyces TaxID=2593676 RepID=UPI00136DE874|nr:hypothetical protein [Streptomyces sp. SID5770]MZE50898.1 hypothetical protein [Streptomyces sp. SID5770]